MTVEIHMPPERSFSGDQHKEKCVENEENVSPLATKSVVVLLKSTSMHAINSKQAIQENVLVSTPIKFVVSSGVDNLLTQISSSPVKRPIDSDIEVALDCSGEPLSKRPSTPSFSLDNFNPKLLSQSASAGKLRPVVGKRVKTNLSQSCFADIRTNKVEENDADLTCLNWLQEGNLLKGFSPGRKPDSDDIAEESQDSDEHSDLQLDSKDPLNLSIASEVEKLSRKPAYSFSALIFMAIESTENKCMAVKDIYKWIQDNFPYFQTAPPGWKNSIRHNLSLNKSFRKDTNKKKCIGKGSLWTIDHEARAGLVQQLRKANIYNSYPFFKTSFTRSLFREKNNIYKRDAAGRFLRYHDDKEFDVAATMCSLSSPSITKHYEQKVRQSGKIDHAINMDLLKIWRTHLEPYETSSKRKKVCSKAKYSMSDFITEVKTKLSFQEVTNPTSSVSLCSSYDEDYDFQSSDESDSEDEEMSENMKRLVEKEYMENLGDSGYSEEGTFKSVTMLDHSYSKPIQLTNRNDMCSSNPVDGLLYLANAASQELEKIRTSEEISKSSIS